MRKYYEEFGTPLTNYQLKNEILNAWISAGLAKEEINLDNRRETLILPTNA
jgi:hypothetical protein